MRVIDDEVATRCARRPLILFCMRISDGPTAMHLLEGKVFLQRQTGLVVLCVGDDLGEG